MYPSNIVNWNEHYLKNRRKTYYIVRMPGGNGLFAHYCVSAGHIVYALKNGYFPVIDMQNYSNIYLEPDLLGKENSWEYYFCQPLGIGLDEAYAGDDVILSSKDVETYPGTRVFSDAIHLTEWRMLVKLGLLKIQPEMYKDIMKEYHSIFLNNERVLGVLLRGTDYVALKPPRHPIPPPLDFALETVKKLREQWNCKKIFLATEDYNIFKKFKEYFEDDCLTIDRPYVQYDDKKNIGSYSNNRKNDRFLNGKEYLTQMTLLTKCNCFVTAMCSGAVGVMMMTEGFDQMVVFNCGYYPDTPPQCVHLNFILHLLNLLIKIAEVIYYACSSKQFNGYVR